MELDNDFDPKILEMLEEMTDADIIARASASVMMSPQPRQQYQQQQQQPPSIETMASHIQPAATWIPTVSPPLMRQPILSPRSTAAKRKHQPQQPQPQEKMRKPNQENPTDEERLAFMQEVMEDEAVMLDPVQMRIVEAAMEGKSMFVSGEAGTGKSHTLKYMVKELAQRGKAVNVVSFFGVAACNVGGSTIHNFAGISGNDRPPYRIPENPDARARIAATDVLVIDEISTVPGEMLDGLHDLFQTVRERFDAPFGGMQIIAVGDFYQLPPVDDSKKRMEAERTAASVRAEMMASSGMNGDPTGKLDWAACYRFKKQATGNWNSLTPVGAPIQRCFKAKCWPHIVQNAFWMDRVYRQTDPVFLQVLHEVREGAISPASRQILDSRLMSTVMPGRTTDDIPEDYVVLYSRRAEAERHNAKRLDDITDDQGYQYSAIDRAVSDKLLYQLKNSAVQQSVWVKVGARVMLKKNVTRTLVNGSRGVVIGYCEIFAIERATNVYRPIEGCILSRAAGLDALSSRPLTSDYRPPEGYDLGENHQFPPYADLTTICPRSILKHADQAATAAADPTRGTAALGETDPELIPFTLVPEVKIRSLRANRFYPLPLVLFENGELVVVGPLKCVKIEDGTRQKKSRKPFASNNNNSTEILSRIQIPLIPAWSLTVHMSQGITVRKLCVDLGKDLFAPGQAYVGISRATSLNGLLIKSLDYSKIYTDVQVLAFHIALMRWINRISPAAPVVVAATANADGEGGDE